MPYPAGHRNKTRKRIVESARRLFNRRGFEGVSVSEIMAGAGLTHGGFYSYFATRSDLYTEALNCFFTDPEWKNCWEGVQVDLASANAVAQVVRAYLSPQHFEDVENSCPMKALPTDVARADENVKQAFGAVFQAMVSILERGAPKGRSRHTAAKATAALCIGGMVVARALRDRERADELREACMRVALDLCGAKRTPKKRKNETARFSKPAAGRATAAR
jgi:TetR/AcrR family transcriptional repressor of nem operon